MTMQLNIGIFSMPTYAIFTSEKDRTKSIWLTFL